MSTNRGREVAYRLFATEYDDADLEYAESDEERAPNYVVTPTGSRANRAFVAGVLTEITPVGDEEVLRARVADPTGAFVLYAGQYQPEALAVIEEAEPPAFLAVTGKARTFQPEDGDRTFTSLRPETITHVDGDVRDHHVVTAAERTIERVDTLALALQSDLTGDALRGALEAAGLDAPRADGIALAIDHYDPSPTYLDALRDRAVQALALVAGEREEVETLDLAPDANPEALSASDLSTAFAAVDGPLEAPPGTEDGDAADETEDAQETEPAAGATEDESAASNVPSEPNEETATADVTDETAGETPTADSADEAADSVDEPEEQIVAGNVEEPAAETPADEGAEQPPTETSADGTEEATTADTDDLGGFELDEEEREELESEFPTDFETGNDVGEAGEADIDVPEPDELAEAESAAPADADQSAESPPETEVDETASDSETDDSAAGSDAEEAGAEDLVDAVIDRMGSLDEGDGVERDSLIAAVVDETGDDPDAVDDAIDEALMDGRCYAPGDDTLKPI